MKLYTYVYEILKYGYIQLPNLSVLNKLFNFYVSNSVCCCSVTKLCPTLCDPMDCSTHWIIYALAYPQGGQELYQHIPKGTPTPVPYVRRKALLSSGQPG